MILDYTVRTVALGAAVLGAVSGALGTFAVLRRQSLLGDAMSHAALPGIALAFLVTRQKDPWVLVAGAAVACWLAALAVMAVVRQGRVKYDGALALVLSVFFGFGLVLLTAIQRLPDATQAGLDKFLFGQAAALLARDVTVMGLLGGTAIAILLAGWTRFQVLSFDPDFAHSLGLRVRGLDVLLTSLLVVAIVIGLQTVGVVLMSALVVAPAAAARQWSDRLGPTVALAALFGAVAGASGALLSSVTERLPTGPTIVLSASVIVALSLAFGPARGLVWDRIRAARNRATVQADLVLRALHALARGHEDPHHPHAEAVLALSLERKGVRRALEALEERGQVTRAGPRAWALTEDGLAAADRAEAPR
ncbi:MAG TPA: metal ABC transporter permease [Gemmatimonadales bacterium]|nr:metal ABC transporter permease [Gemmatimonadales bacterium]